VTGSSYDVLIVGGGIVGLATAMRLLEREPRLKVALLEKETDIACHQTGHNSGVIHSGVYYKPGSLKARSCASGRKALIEFCERAGVPYRICGKVVLATRPEEVPLLEELARRGTANGLSGLETIGPERLKEIEPHAAALKALYVPETGIVDFRRVARAFAGRTKEMGGDILTSCEARKIRASRDELVVETPSGAVRARRLINCAGLFSDRLAEKAAVLPASQPDAPETVRIIPFRGDYYRLVPERRALVRALIYPLPDPLFPFLGVHLTRTIDDEVEAGPNAVLAFAREGYRKTDFRPDDFYRLVTYRGFWSLAGRYWRTAVQEFHRSLSKAAFVRALQRLVPDIGGSDILPGGAGVRAQAVSSAGFLLDDFVIRRTENSIHVLNAPSPAATASLSIADHIVDMARQTFLSR
jgi:L-2-hydroxyglutarate oxidase LhgO